MLTAFSRAKQDTTLPLQYPVRTVDGSSVSVIPLEKGTQLLISIIASNHNKEVWGEDASEWKPERWMTKSEDRDSAAVKSSVRYPGAYSSM